MERYRLQVLSTCVQAAQQADPVSADDRDLLLAIPLNAPLPRPILDGSEPVASLYDAVITSAERARHAAWATSTQPAWSPHLTADSLRQVAATSTVTSHHCEILLRSLAARTAGSDTAGLSAGLLRAADAAGRARAGWLHVARALNQVDTDTMRHLAPTAGEARRPRPVHRAPGLRRCRVDPVQRARPSAPATARPCPGSRRRPAGAGRRPPRLRRRDQPGLRPARADTNRGQRRPAPGPHPVPARHHGHTPAVRGRPPRPCLRPAPPVPGHR